ncbi:hypothetical protein [Nocardioides sp. TF02-7]|uniref:hypothetical protein n=1 Tax=Nocardioides sp. TF02-7 TaxID=2917724 RepID=UPI001F05FE19|nr:hypothetical protein [Nocardioides sp. TF02-7]UMG93009.1 hypothetical protein MF408_01230 [Nocardioides sp. TF02-7]
MTTTETTTTPTDAEIDALIKENMAKSMGEIPHPSLAKGTNLYGSTKVFPDFQAEAGEAYFTLVHGVPHESSVSFVAILQATRALRKGLRVRDLLLRPRHPRLHGHPRLPDDRRCRLPRRAQRQRCDRDLRRRGRDGLLLPVRHGVARPPRGGPDRGGGADAPARRPGRRHLLRPQGRDHQLDLQPLSGRVVMSAPEAAGRRVDVAIQGIRLLDAPVARRSGAGPSDDGHLLLDGVGAAVPLNPRSPYTVRGRPTAPGRR